MKRLLALLICIALLFTGCAADTTPTGTTEPTTSETKPAETVAPETTPEPETTPQPTEALPSEPENTALLAVSIPADTEEFILEDGTTLFTYTAQHMELILPDDEVADRVILDFLNRVDRAQSDSESVLLAAKNDYQPDSNWFPYFYQIIYSPTRIDHDVLSLFGSRNSYSGAMHGNVSCVSANYDLSTGDVLTLGSIMHADATKDAFITLIIQKLSESAEELGLFPGYEDGVRSRLSGDENLYEDFFFTGTGLNFFFAPYEIAPYSAGVITVEIPYHELPGLIYDGYFPAERELIQGQMRTATFMETDMEQFNNMAEVNLTTGEEIMVIYPEGKVEDIRIAIAGDGKNMPDYTVFAALEMSTNNAVVLSLSEEEMEKVTVSYSAEGSTTEISLAD